MNASVTCCFFSLDISGTTKKCENNNGVHYCIHELDISCYVTITLITANLKSRRCVLSQIFCSPYQYIVFYWNQINMPFVPEFLKEVSCGVLTYPVFSFYTTHHNSRNYCTFTIYTG